MDELRPRILALLKERQKRPVKLGEMIGLFGLSPADRKELRRLLRSMVADGEIVRARGHQYLMAGSRREVSGILRVSPKGFGFVIPDDQFIAGDEQNDVFVPRKRMGDAMHQDRVMVRIVSQGTKNREGEVIEILERGTRELVGTFYYTKRGGQVIPRDERFNRSLVTALPDAGLNVENGSYVVAEITNWTPSSQPLIGVVREVLGDPDTPGIDITMIVRDAGVEPEFPSHVLRSAEAIPSAIEAREVARRRDFRQLTTFTMDGARAKDFDDALSIEPTERGRWRLGVHIADVAHYVTEDSPIDREAFERATSIYPVDRVVPMLPEKLSNDLCSLRPHEDRLTMSVLMDIDGDGRVKHYEIHEGVIRSSHRLIYEEVQDFLDGTADVELIRAIGDIRPQLEMLQELRLVLTEMRVRRGALDLDIPETEIAFAEDGTVESLVRRPRKETHRIVEECMLIANEVVASHLFNLHVPAVYRVHEDPDLEKLRSLQPVLAHLGVRFPAKHDLTAEAIQGALAMSEKSETGSIARRLILRSMMRAHYSDENLGHFGLASTCYTHYTSPIRRYPDLIVHRLLKECAAAGARMGGRYNPPGDIPPEQGDLGDDRIRLTAPSPLPPQRHEFLRQRLDFYSRHCSERERRAEDIERQALKVKTLEFMRAYIGEEFDGRITSVLTWGLFVELEMLPVDGLVHVRKLTDDFYEYDEERMTLTGRQNGRTLKIGDPVRILVENVNVAALEMDFLLVGGGEAEDKARVRKERHADKTQRLARHAARQPSRGGFQARGGRRKKGHR